MSRFGGGFHSRWNIKPSQFTSFRIVISPYLDCRKYDQRCCFELYSSSFFPVCPLEFDWKMHVCASVSVCVRVCVQATHANPSKPSHSAPCSMYGACMPVNPACMSTESNFYYTSVSLSLPRLFLSTQTHRHVDTCFCGLLKVAVFSENSSMSVVGVLPVNIMSFSYNNMNSITLVGPGLTDGLHMSKWDLPKACHRIHLKTCQ